MKVGGECYFDPNPEGSSPDLLLIAGGVGINPLYSIAQHVADISSDANHQYDGKTVLLFSAKNQDELLYKVHYNYLRKHNLIFNGKMRERWNLWYVFWQLSIWIIALLLNFSDWEVFLWIPSKCEILSTATRFSSTLNTAWNEMKWQTADISPFLSDLKVLFCLL